METKKTTNTNTNSKTTTTESANYSGKKSDSTSNSGYEKDRENVLAENAGKGKDPFKRSHKMARSPTRPTTPTVSDGAGVTEDDTSKMCDPFKGSILTPRTPIGKDIDTASKDKEPKDNEAYGNLGSKIAELIEMMAAQRHVNQTMKDLAHKIQQLYKEASISKDAEAPIAVMQATKEVQTDGLPRIKQGKNPKNVKAQQAALGKQGSRVNRQPTSTTSKATEAERTAREQHKQHTESHAVINDWRLVERKSTVRRPRKLAQGRPDALIISKTGEKSYADILKSIKGKPELKELGESVNKIRRTAKGELLIQLINGASNKTEKFKEQVGNILTDSASVKSLREQTAIICRDLEETATKNDVIKAVKEQFPEIHGLTDSTVKSMRVLRDNTQIATLVLPTKHASKLLQVGKLKVGWVRCRIREKATLTRCYRCLEFGHVAKTCQNTDRGKMCLRCGTEGHIAKTCTANPSCSVCKTKGFSETEHILGSTKCWIYKKAINNRTRND